MLPKALPAGRIYLPDVRNEPAPVTPAKVHDNPHDMSAMAYALFERIRTAPEQLRTEMRPHPLLQAACRQRIADMVFHNQFAHFIDDCFSPNDLVRYLGFPLPRHYARGPRANNIESLGGNTISVADQYNGWYQSPSHFAHVFGRTAFYAEQTHIGLEHLYIDGMADVDSIWVWISAPYFFESPIRVYDFPVIAG